MKKFAEHSEKNKAPILKVLLDYVKNGNFLEVSSGTGQHVSFFAPNFKEVTFFPTEFELDNLPRFEFHFKFQASKNTLLTFQMSSLQFSLT
jgi:hypothetical protein